jgi:hypothetical protein
MLYALPSKPTEPELHTGVAMRACISAFALLIAAIFIVFGIPHGANEVRWYMALLPGGFFAAPFSAYVWKMEAGLAWRVFLGLLLCFDFLWYFVLSYAAQKALGLKGA